MFAWFWVAAHWFPLREGRDAMTYFLCFRDVFQIEPEFPLLMLFRTPLTPLFYGACFEFLGSTGVEFVLAILYAGSTTAVFAVVRDFSVAGAWVVNVLIAVNLWLFRWFNAVGSETLQTVLLCGWFGLQREVKKWKLPSVASLSPASEALYEMSRKVIPNFLWFLFGAFFLVFAGLTGPIDIRVPLLTGFALISLLVTLFGSVQWEFRYPFDPIFTAFAVHACHCLSESLRG
ncbi:MAG: hypothetical protein WA376_20755, partial [Terrimicrobiaceae bacterium]